MSFQTLLPDLSIFESVSIQMHVRATMSIAATMPCRTFVLQVFVLRPQVYIARAMHVACFNQVLSRTRITPACFCMLLRGLAKGSNKAALSTSLHC